MWWALALVSAVFLGGYDVAKKKALQKNSVMWVLFAISALSTLMLSPWFSFDNWHGVAILVPKAFMVTASWISGLAAIKRLPLTIASTIKASRPVFVVVFSIILFGEQLNAGQWAGVVISLSALIMLSGTGRREGIDFSHNTGILWMAVSVVTGVASALYDKHIIAGLAMDPTFVLCWSNLLITLLMGITLGIRVLTKQETKCRFSPDWYILLSALTIIVADACYFQSLSAEGAMLSVISLLRRSSVIVTFVISAIVFHEENIGRKALIMAVMLGGITLLALAS